MIRAVILATGFALLLAPKAPPKEAAPALPAPDVKLRVEPHANKPWRLEVTNNSSTPLRVVADARLLRMTIEPPPSTTPLKKGQKAPAPAECALPGSMRSDERTLTLPPGGKWAEDFDPRLYCLDRTDKLVDGAILTARLGWAPPKGGKLSAPFAVVPESADIASAKEIAAASIVLDADMYPLKNNTGLGPIIAAPGGARSVGNGKDTDVTLVLRNIGAESHTLYPRPQLVDAMVLNPRGQVIPCRGAAIVPAPIAEFITKLPPKGVWQATVPLAALCPSGTFDRPGLYLVTPMIHLPPMPQVQNEVSGDISADRPQLVRVETGSKPFYDAPPAAAKP